jgi:Tfp pilus assembly protein PilF
MRDWFRVFAFFFVCGLLVYFNSLNNKLLMDDNNFLGNPLMSQEKFIFSQWDPFREQALGVLDSPGNLDYYRPLSQMAYIFFYSTFKTNYWQYHLLAIFLFSFASSLVYLLIEKLTGNHILAFLTGLFYLIHPINGDAVNYFYAGICLFQLVLMLGSILLLLESLDRQNSRPLYFLSLIFCFLSLFWHEKGVMTPFYISAVILFFRKDTLKKKVSYLLPYFLIVFSYLVFWLNFIGTSGNIRGKVAFYHMSVWQYLASLFQVDAWYIGKLFYPKGIGMQWAAPLLYDHIFFNVLGAGLSAGIFLLLFFRFSKDSVSRLALTWILIGFAPVCLTAFRLLGNAVSIEPNWMVLSSIGFFILAARFCVVVLDRRKTAGLALLFVLVFAWGSFAYAYNQVWADQKTYALYWSRQDPYMKSSYHFVADAYYHEGNFKDAEKYYRMALSGHTSDQQVYIHLGAIEQAGGHFKDAESNYKIALQINPYSADAYHNLGSIDYAQGRLDRARENFNRSIALNPLGMESRRALAVMLFEHSEYQKAVSLCLKNLDIVKDDPGTLLLLMDIDLRLKDEAGLKEYAYRYIRAETDPEKLTKLGVHMARENVVEVALDCFKKAMSTAPDYKEAYLAAGTLFANLGQYEEAVHIWEIGLKVDPSDQRFKSSIAKAAAIQSK